MGIIEGLAHFTAEGSIQKNEHQLEYVQARIAVTQEVYGKVLEKYTFDDDGTGQREVRRLESNIQGLLKEEQEIILAIQRLRVLEKVIREKARQDREQTI